MNVLEYLQQNILYLDGGMGTLLQKEGLKPGEYPEEWNISHSDIVTKLHKSYYDAGSNVVSTNTFGANILKFDEDHLEEIIKCAVNNAKIARETSTNENALFIAGDVGPLGKLIKPFGDLEFEDAIKIYKVTAKLLEKYGVDFIFVETMNDAYETKAAVLAIKESTNLPLFVSNAYEEIGNLMSGTSCEAMVAMLEGLKVDAIGLNCSFGPKAQLKTIERIQKVASIPVIFKPNAGLPKVIDNKTVYDVDEDDFAKCMVEAINLGVRVVGGCCGTTPKYIKALVDLSKECKPKEIDDKELTVITSSKALYFGDTPILIGERINPTGKKRIKEALKNNEIDYLLSEGVSQQDKGVDALDVNVGIPEIDEPSMLKNVVTELQWVVNIPLQIDSSNPEALEKAMRIYNGKPLINSVNGKRESMDSVFPLAKKYGGVVVALTLDENGIPDNPDDRFEIAKKILDVAKEYGIDKKDIIFDTLTMSISTDEKAGQKTVEAIKRISSELKVNTMLGVSNISYGMPDRDTINSQFFFYAMENGLSSAIMNPYSDLMMDAYYRFTKKEKSNSSFDDIVSKAMEDIDNSSSDIVKNIESTLQYSIIRGLKDKAHLLTKDKLENDDAISIIKEEIVPSLDIVGKAYEEKKIYLPQLLMAAEAAKASFEAIKLKMGSGKSSVDGNIVIATVHGDIHDIGKNIVKLLLENYGFNVIDLGKDVKEEVILNTVLETNAKLLCLSALMTTTLESMKNTIKLVKNEVEGIHICVGGAVLTEEYAKSIGADKYCKDAMETVRYAESILK